MVKAVPSLTDLGWVVEAPIALSKIISYYIMTDGSQTTIFADNVYNLPLSYYKHINDPDGMRLEIQSDLEGLLNRYFDNHDVEVTIKALSDSKYAILLYVAVFDELGKIHKLSKVIEMNIGGIKNVIDVMNQGEGTRYLNQLLSAEV